MKCIFCDDEFDKGVIEHIVPESLGNIYYTLPQNTICNLCNNKFSEFEEKSISKSVLGFFRSRNGYKTKKGKASTFAIGNVKGFGDNDFKKNVIRLEGLEENNIDEFNPRDGSYKITIPDFANTEMAASKFLLKMAYESLYKSKKEIFNQYNFTDLKRYLTNKDNKDWSFITSHRKLYDFKSIPRFNDRYQLSKIKCSLGVAEITESILLFNFHYDLIDMTTNLLNRDYSWSKIYFDNDVSTTLYPKYLKR